MAIIDWYCRAVLEGRFCLVSSNAYCNRRRRQAAYLARKKHVKCFWLGAAATVLIFPVLHVAVMLAFFTTFVSFMYLDEV